MNKSMRNVKFGQIFLLFGLTLCALALADGSHDLNKGGGRSPGKTSYESTAEFLSAAADGASLGVNVSGAAETKADAASGKGSVIRDGAAKLKEIGVYSSKMQTQCGADTSSADFGHVLETCYVNFDFMLSARGLSKGGTLQVNATLLATCQAEIKSYFDKKKTVLGAELSVDDKKLLETVDSLTSLWAKDVTSAFTAGGKRLDEAAAVTDAGTRNLLNQLVLFNDEALNNMPSNKDNLCKFEAAQTPAEIAAAAKAKAEAEEAEAKKKAEAEAAAAAAKAKETADETASEEDRAKTAKSDAEQKKITPGTPNAGAPNVSPQFPNLTGEQPGFNPTAEQNPLGGLQDILPALLAARNNNDQPPPVIPPAAAAAPAEAAQPAPAAPVVPPQSNPPPPEQQQQPQDQAQDQGPQQQQPMMPMPQPTPQPTPNYDQMYERERQARQDAKEERAAEAKQAKEEDAALEKKAQEAAKAEVAQQAQQYQMMMASGGAMGGQYPQGYNNYQGPAAGATYGMNAQKLQKVSRSSSRTSTRTVNQETQVSTGGSTRGELGPISARGAKGTKRSK